MSRYTLFDRDSCLSRVIWAECDSDALRQALEAVAEECVISAWCLYRKEANNRLLRLVAEVNDGTVC